MPEELAELAKYYSMDIQSEVGSKVTPWKAICISLFEAAGFSSNDDFTSYISFWKELESGDFSLVSLLKLK